MSETIRRIQTQQVSKGTLRDQMTHASPDAVARAGFRCLDVIQSETEGVQITALALMTLMYCKKYGADPREVLGRAGAIIEDGLASNNEHIGATARFLKVHLKGDTQAFF